MSKSISDRKKLLEWLESEVPTTLQSIADGVTGGLKDGGVVFACGNGGSASQAEHFVAELVGRFKRDRKALRAQALSANTSTVTAIANDYGFENVFARQLDGVAKRGDCLVAFSTSGTSPNVVNACRAAHESGMRVFVFTGQSYGPMAASCDVALAVPSTDTAVVQEVHFTALHIICEIVEKALFSASDTPSQNV